jgi:hypothetical protein
MLGLTVPPTHKSFTNEIVWIDGLVSGEPMITRQKYEKRVPCHQLVFDDHDSVAGRGKRYQACPRAQRQRLSLLRRTTTVHSGSKPEFIAPQQQQWRRASSTRRSRPTATASPSPSASPPPIAAIQSGSAIWPSATPSWRQSMNDSGGLRTPCRS